MCPHGADPCPAGSERSKPSDSAGGGARRAGCSTHGQLSRGHDGQPQLTSCHLPPQCHTSAMCPARPCKTLPPGPLSRHKGPDAAQAGTQTQLTKCPLLLYQVLCEYSPSLVILVFSYHYNSALKRRWETFSGQFRAEISHLCMYMCHMYL